MEFLIFGTGAVGAYLGGRLSMAGHRVTFLARPAWADALRRDGLRLEQGGRIHTVPTPGVLTEIPPGLDLGPRGAILLTVKAYDCAAAADGIARSMRGSVPLVSLLNGVGAEVTLAQALGAGRIVPATLTTAISVVAPGAIRVERERGLGIALLASADPTAEALMGAGIAVRRYPDAGAMKWSKLPTNLIANAASAILGWTAGQTIHHPGLARLEIEAIRETVRTMRRLGIRPVDLPGVPVRRLAAAIFLPVPILRPLLARAVASGRGDKLPSFHHDIGRGRSEVGWLNGAVVAAARTVGLAAPANRLLLAVLVGLVEGRDDPASWRDRPERLLERARQEGVPGIPRGSDPTA